MTKSIFTRLGADAFLRLTEPCTAEVHFGVAVAVSGEYGELTSSRTVIGINYGSLPKPRTGDKLIFNGITYVLDSLLKEDGYSSRWIVN